MAERLQRRLAAILSADVVGYSRLYGDLVMVLSTVLRIKRTLNGREIDQIIRDVETRKALAIEQQRRADWRKSELAASRFRAECDYLDGAVATSSTGQVP
jgi:hypothetical protein